MISQSSYQPSENATVTLEFDTNNELPLNASISVLAPIKIPMVWRNPKGCWVVLNNIRVNNVCDFVGPEIIFKGFINQLYSEYTSYKFVGRIELNF
jgi:hypothetical protein